MEVFLKEIKIIRISPCWADAAKIRLEAELSRDIEEIMPYLNNIIKSATYVPGVPSLTFMKEGRLITLYSKQLTMAKALNTTDAYQVLGWLKDLINSTYERRCEIEPYFETRSRPAALHLYQQLPRTNCRQCGETNCLAFAAKLFLGEKTIGQCKPLFTEEYKHLREAIQELITALGYEVPEKSLKLKQVTQGQGFQVNSDGGA